MKKIKNYQEFTNEELNWKSALTGAALGASLALGSPEAKTQTTTSTEKVYKDPTILSTPLQKEVKKMLSDNGVFFKMLPGKEENHNFLEFDLNSFIGKAKVKVTFILNAVIEDEENFHYEGDDYQSTEISNLNPKVKEELLKLQNEKPEWILNIVEKPSKNSFVIITKDATKLIDWLYQ